MTPHPKSDTTDKEKRDKYVAWLNESKTPEQRNARKMLAYAYLYNASTPILNKLTEPAL
jgi:hypothetical protein